MTKCSRDLLLPSIAPSSRMRLSTSVSYTSPSFSSLIFHSTAPSWMASSSMMMIRRASTKTNSSRIFPSTASSVACGCHGPCRATDRLCSNRARMRALHSSPYPLTSSEIRSARHFIRATVLRMSLMFSRSVSTTARRSSRSLAGLPSASASASVPPNSSSRHVACLVRTNSRSRFTSSASRRAAASTDRSSRSVVFGFPPMAETTTARRSRIRVSSLMHAAPLDSSSSSSSSP
mmetsp:Transcript_7621/g.18769  ORF Transcript_7621/g.18769 Transcript_7621/m.18769 type:complete len:234 (+) Transcript_7621:1978-2679(+)